MGHEIYNFGKPSLDIIIIYPVPTLSDPCLRVEKKILKKYINFPFFTPKLSSPWTMRVMKLKFFCLLTNRQDDSRVELQKQSPPFQNGGFLSHNAMH